MGVEGDKPLMALDNRSFKRRLRAGAEACRGRTQNERANRSDGGSVRLRLGPAS